MTEISNKFHEKALEIYELGKQLCGYNATRFLQKVRRDGGVKAAKSWLNPKSINKSPTGGFLKLVEVGRLDISLEALVLRKPWNQLFSSEELNVARKRLHEFGYNEVELADSENQALIPEEVDSPEKYVEGSYKQIRVNIYERNAKARAECIRHYGAKCFACGFNFSEFYSVEFDGFIHVHHLRPLATIASEYELNPIRDLRPVCANCHAVIHKKDPPYTIHQIKSMISKK